MAMVAFQASFDIVLWVSRINPSFKNQSRAERYTEMTETVIVKHQVSSDVDWIGAFSHGDELTAELGLETRPLAHDELQQNQILCHRYLHGIGFGHLVLLEKWLVFICHLKKSFIFVIGDGWEA